ncbi:boule protein [Culex quinquefasciatus]|uniref:Boule protein n=1 Tax=Culex quinquefasciatus TaxID=7176 RepID=B0X6Z6_CULQU|nr:boule protein [Culex quinquefasciatus]|eukprot:XP_001865418.1 boule protein [Culex quinquefasciatus]
MHCGWSHSRQNYDGDTFFFSRQTNSRTVERTSFHGGQRGDCIVLRDRKLNIAPAIKKQTICATNGAVYYAATPPTPTINNIPIEQFATVYPPGVPTIYPPTMPYQPFYQYYSVPMVGGPASLVEASP